MLVRSGAELTADGTYVITGSSKEEYYGMSAILNGKYIERTGDAAITVTDGVISNVPDNMALVKIEPLSGGKYALHVYDIKGASKGYICSATAKSLSFASSASAEGVAAGLSVSDSNVTVDYGSAGTLQYNASAPRFLTYTSNQRPLQFYKKVEKEPVEPIVVPAPELYAVDQDGNDLVNYTFSGSCVVEIVDSDKEAMIYYTLDGTAPEVVFNDKTPSAAGATIAYDGALIEFEKTTTVRAVAAREGVVSDETAHTYEYVAPIIEVAAPTLSATDAEGKPLVDNTFGTTCNVTISTDDAEAHLYYTLDGTAPEVTFSDSEPMVGNTSTVEYSGDPIVLDATTTVRAVAAKEGTVSDEVSDTYIYDKNVGVEIEHYLDDMVGVFGNNILAPEGSRIYDLKGTAVSGLDCEPGIYIVVNADYGRPVKIIIR